MQIRSLALHSPGVLEGQRTLEDLELLIGLYIH
eukprot:COSAG03_NODE_22296_length_293_cov_0.448454_1_plen_32_part_10